MSDVIVYAEQHVYETFGIVHQCSGVIEYLPRGKIHLFLISKTLSGGHPHHAPHARREPRRQGPREGRQRLGQACAWRAGGQWAVCTTVTGD